MSEKLRESLSALMDDEANELEVARVLANIDSDEELRQTWSRYHTARDAASGHSTAFLDVDISRRIQAAVAEQGGAVGAPVSGLRERLLRPLGSFAVAASVAAVVVLSGQQMVAQRDTGSQQVAYTNSTPNLPVSLIPEANSVKVSLKESASGRPQLSPASSMAYKQLARMRMARYMQEHAEQAALNSPHGLVPYARVPKIAE